MSRLGLERIRKVEKFIPIESGSPVWKIYEKFQIS
jgi:hypothetical protein